MTEQDILRVRQLANMAEKHFESINVWKENLERADTLLCCIEQKGIEPQHACITLTSTYPNGKDEEDTIQIPQETFIRALKHCIAYSKKHIEESESIIANYQPFTINEPEPKKAEDMPKPKPPKFPKPAWVKGLSWSELRRHYFGKKLKE